MASAEAPRPLPPGAWRRGGGIEFDRVANFTDAVFAIALTLLVLEVGVAPLREASSASEMLDALQDAVPELIGFAVAFLLIGRYWMAQHTFFALLRAVDGRFIGLLMVYLAFLALLPFPASLVGEYEENSVAVVLFALVLAAVSGMETVLLAHARRAGLLRVPMPASIYRYALRASTAPVVVFVVTIPLAFVSTTLTLLSWLPLTLLFGRLAVRGAPPEAERWLLAATSEAPDPGTPQTP